MKTDAKVLHLPIKGVWFSMIASGEKKEEYRDKKNFYGIRFCEGWDSWIFAENHEPKFRKFDTLHLTAGYGDHRPQLWAEIESITIGMGNPAWGAEPGVDYFVIKIGKILHTKNFVLQSEPSQESNV